MTNTALITGASSGIGYELAKVFAEKGHDLVLVARTKSKLDKLAKELKETHGIKVKVLAKDLSLENTPKEIFDALKKAKVNVEFLVNNAGLGISGDFDEQDWESVDQMLKVNIFALTKLTHIFLPEMKARKTGKIVNIASIAAFQPGPNMAVYFATKSYVLSFSEAIAEELRGSGITVTAVCPGLTKTPFFEIAQVKTTENIFENMLMQSPREVALTSYRAMKKGKTVEITGLLNKLSANASTFIPNRLLNPMTGFALKNFTKK